MTSHPTPRPRTWSLASAALLAAAATVLTACSSSGGTSTAATHSAPAATHTVTSTHTVAAPAAAAPAVAATHTSAEQKLAQAMLGLWDEHMEWTYATIAAFAAGSPGFQATLDRLLQNQTDIGNAIKPYYGEKAAKQLSTLLHQHILGYVPVLKAAKAGDKAGVQTAFAKVLANGVQIGKFLESANPKNWPAPTMQDMMNTHNEQTLKYAALQLQGKYKQSITEYGKAEAHMRDMAQMLTAGIVAQFPDKFAS